MRGKKLKPASLADQSGKMPLWKFVEETHQAMMEVTNLMDGQDKFSGTDEDWLCHFIACCRFAEEKVKKRLGEYLLRSVEERAAKERDMGSD